MTDCHYIGNLAIDSCAGGICGCYCHKSNGVRFSCWCQCNKFKAIPSVNQSPYVLRETVKDKDNSIIFLEEWRKKKLNQI